MSEPTSRSLDIFGTKPVAEAAKAITQSVIDGATAFLSRICLPASEEFGLLLQDKVRTWRARNAVAIIAKAEQKLAHDGAQLSMHAHPRLVGQILEQGSWSDDDKVQDMWAGLMASSCDENGQDDSNMMFVDFLSRLSVPQVRVLNYACKKATVSLSPGGWLTAEALHVDLGTLQEISGTKDLHRLDRELDHLRILGLMPVIGAGFSPDSTTATLSPTAVALHMFARCNGHRGDPPSFFGVVASGPAA